MLSGVQSGLLLLVDADRRAQRGITRVAAEVGVEVVACDSARAGLNAACALEPAAIVTELELPDFDGYWFVAQIRQQPTDVAACPIVVVTHEIDTSSRAGTLKAGADVFLQKPIAPADLVAQTRALVDMVHRLRDRRPAVSGPGGGAPGLMPALASAAVAAPHLLPPSGGLDRFPAATVLVALELERRSGRVTLRPPSAVAPPIEIDLASGLILEGRIQGRRLDPLAVVRAALVLDDGYFEFVPGADRPAPPTAEFTGKLFAMAVSEAAPPPRSRRNAPAPLRPPPVEVVAPSMVDELLTEKPSPKVVVNEAIAAKGSPKDEAPVEKESPKGARPPTRPPPPPPPKSATARPPSRPSRTPKAAAKVAPVKVPPARVPAFGPVPPLPPPKPPLAKPPVPDAAHAPPRPGVPPPPLRPAALAHSSAAKPASASPGPDTRRRGAAAVAVRRTAPPPARPDADDDDVIEAENENET